MGRQSQQYCFRRQQDLSARILLITLHLIPFLALYSKLCSRSKHVLVFHWGPILPRDWLRFVWDVTSIENVPSNREAPIHLTSSGLARFLPHAYLIAQTNCSLVTPSLIYPLLTS